MGTDTIILFCWFLLQNKMSPISFIVTPSVNYIEKEKEKAGL